MSGPVRTFSGPLTILTAIGFILIAEKGEIYTLGSRKP